MITIRPVDWVIILWSSVNRGLLAGVVGPKPMVLTLPNTNNKWVRFGLANVETFVIRVEFRLANVDTIRTLTRHEHDPWTRIATPSFILALLGSFLFVDKKGRHVHLCFLPLLRDLTQTSTYN